MISILDILEALERAPRGNARLAVLGANNSSRLREILTLALSPQITFGIKQLPGPIPPSVYTASDVDTWYKDLLQLLSRLRNRELTGSEAQTNIGIFLGSCDELQRKWSKRILKQDLRLDIGINEVNRVLGAGTIFQFSVPLAEDYMKVKPKALLGRWCVEPKLDGARCVALLLANGGPVQLLSRTGKEWTNFESIREVLQEINITNCSPYTRVLDGEVVAIVDDRINFQAIQSVLFRKKSGNEQLKYLVFDATTWDEWEDPMLPYCERYEVAREFLSSAASTVPGCVGHIGLVEMFEVIDPTHQDMRNHSIEFVHRGFEGAIYRRSLDKVVLKRSKALLKVKSFIDDEAEVVGAIAGNGKYQGMLGGLECRTKNGEIFEVGSGFSDEQREQLWDAYMLGKLPKQLTYKYFEMTDDGKPRFPVFKGFRHLDDIEP